MNITSELIAQFFHTTNASQNFGGAEAGCQSGGCLFCVRKITLRDSVAGSQNISPPGEQCLDHSGAALQVKTFGERLVVSLTFIQPRAISRILILCDFFVQCLVCFALHLLANCTEQTLKFLGQPVCTLNSPVFFTGRLL